jgi:hypothetical protein
MFYTHNENLRLRTGVVLYEKLSYIWLNTVLLALDNYEQ